MLVAAGGLDRAGVSKVTCKRNEVMAPRRWHPCRPGRNDGMKWGMKFQGRGHAEGS